MNMKSIALTGICILGTGALQAQVQEQVQEQENQEMGPLEDVNEAARIVDQMQQDLDIASLLNKAEGVFLVPDYAAASLIVGGAGGEGVLVERQEAGWSNPAFYDIGSASLGAQAGVEAGSIALILMSDEAMNSFKDENTFSITGQAGLTVLNWSARAQGETGDLSDLVVWTDTEGLLGELAVGFTNINWDEEENREFYGESASPSQVLAGEVDNPHDDTLGEALRSG